MAITHGRFAHIINPVASDPGSRFNFVQQVTFNSMLAARRMAEQTKSEQICINFYSSQFPEDRGMLPEEFYATQDLDRSILDNYALQNGRKLPFLADIINRVYLETDEDYMIYTNVDIGLMPSFYMAVDEAVRSGLDAFTINRRSISEKYTSVEQLPEMYADPGEPHRGWDCFVFRREIIPDLNLGQVCVGAPLVGLAMLANLIVFSNNFKQFTEEHWTFHIGNDRKWNRKANQVYARHNRMELQSILPELSTRIGGFPIDSPPGVYLRNHNNPIRAWFYEWTRSLYIPVKFTKKLKRSSLS
jgi:hypothetical protein